jgi:hypothetical protein
MSTSTLSEQAFHRATTPMFAILTPEQTRQLAELQADPLLANRIEYLAGRANEGVLTDDERDEYEAYIDANNLLAMIQSEARSRITNDER